MILSGSGNQHLAHALASTLDEAVVPVRARRFPDGELIVEVDTETELPAMVTLGDDAFAIDDRAVVIASTVDDRALIEVLQLQDLAREGGAKEVVTVVPYFGYGRQDVAHDPGQPASARAMARALSAGTDRLVTVNLHEPAVLDYCTVEAQNVSAVNALAGGIDLDTDDVLFVAPDAGARDLAAQLRDVAGRGRFDHLEKHRIDDTTVEITMSETSVEGQTVVLIDDEIATGGTMTTATRMLLDAGATAVHAACVHPVLVGNAYTRLRRAGLAGLVATDTIERPVSTVSAAGAIAEVL